MDQQKPGGPLLKVGAEGLEVSGDMPNVLAKILPVSWIAQRTIDHALLGRVQQKIRTNTPLDDFEMQFVEMNLNEQTAKFLRLQRIQQRAIAILPTLAPLALPQASSAESQATEQQESKAATSEDWLNKFREDASLVDDEVVQEVYARILASECSQAGSVTLRTLRVLRYLDREVANAFGLLQNIVMDAGIIPAIVGPFASLTAKYGLTFGTFLSLEDAGLIHYGTPATFTKDAALRQAFRLPAHGRVVVARLASGQPFSVAINVRALTQAGEELARIAQCEPIPELLEAILELLKTETGAELHVARVQSPRDWNGVMKDLEWEKWQEPPVAGGAE